MNHTNWHSKRFHQRSHKSLEHLAWILQQAHQNPAWDRITIVVHMLIERFHRATEKQRQVSNDVVYRKTPVAISSPLIEVLRTLHSISKVFRNYCLALRSTNLLRLNYSFWLHLDTQSNSYFGADMPKPARAALWNRLHISDNRFRTQSISHDSDRVVLEETS